LLEMSSKSCGQTHMIYEIDIGHANGFTLAEQSLEAMTC
jgi:hypothetical protein